MAAFINEPLENFKTRLQIQYSNTQHVKVVG